MNFDKWYSEWDVVKLHHYLQRQGHDAKYNLDGTFLVGNDIVTATWGAVQRYVYNRRESVGS